MATEPTRYASQEDAEKAVARLNAKRDEGYFVESRPEVDNKTVWYVKQRPPMCPVRGVDLSTIRAEPWHTELASMQKRCKKLAKRLLLGIAITVLGLVLEFTLDHGGSHVGSYLMLPIVCLAEAIAIWSLICFVVIHRKYKERHSYFNCECGKQIGTDVDWICGQCNYKNEKGNGAWDSILLKCSRCAGAPAAITCYHCGRVIPLIAGGDFRHPAYAAGGPVFGETQTVDPVNERKLEAERRTKAFEEEIKAYQAEKNAVMTEKELEDARRELKRTASSEFEKQMMAMEEFTLGDEAIFQAVAAEEARIRARPDLDEPEKKRRIDRVRLFAAAKLSERKFR